MIRRPPRSTLSSSSAASDVYKRQVLVGIVGTSRVTVRSVPGNVIAFRIRAGDFRNFQIIEVKFAAIMLSNPTGPILNIQFHGLVTYFQVTLSIFTGSSQNIQFIEVACRKFNFLTFGSYGILCSVGTASNGKADVFAGYFCRNQFGRNGKTINQVSIASVFVGADHILIEWQNNGLLSW